MKRTVILLLAVLMLILTPAMQLRARAAETGTCGENLTWTLDDAGTLTVSGTGAMDKFSDQMPAPWNSHKSQIKTVKIEEGVTSVGNTAFYDCTALTAVTVPQSVKKIAQGAFGGKNSLQSITVDEENPEYASENGVLFNKSKTALLQYPSQKKDTDYSIPEGVTEISDCAFEKCDNLTSVSFPNSLRTIGHFAFLECDGLQQISIPDNVTELGYSVFQSCTKLKRVEIGKGITDLGICVFDNCASLEEVILPDTLVNIWENVFAYCTSLKSLQLPAGMNFISDGAFHDCTALEEIVIGGVKEIYWPFENCASLKKVTFLGDAPSYCTLAFDTMTLTAYYPAGNATWTEALRQSFGGNVTWKPYCIAHTLSDWITEGNTSTRTCIVCGYTEQKVNTGSGDVEFEIPEQPEVDAEVELVLPSDSSYVLVEEALDSQTILKVFDIHLKNSDGVHVQPSGTVKVKLPLDWEKNGYYKVYRVNDDGTLTDMNAYRQGSHMVFETDHFSLYALVELDQENPFEDVSFYQWYTAPVLWAVEKNITKGMTETTFVPDGTCTRAQIVTFLWRANGSPAPTTSDNPFTDVPAGAWYTDAVLWAVGEGITTGTSATTFSPEAPCTRGQVATFLWRAEEKPASGGENIFTDITPGAYYYDAVLWAVENGITNGMGEGLFAPDATCTRGQIVTFLYRAMTE